MTAKSGFIYVNANGSLNLDGIKLFRSLEARLDASEARLKAIAAIVAPVGGATIDAEARAAIVAILAASG